MTTRPSARSRRWASLPNAAAYFDCSVDTLRRYISAGHLPAHRVPNGKTIRVDLNEVDDMVVPVPNAGMGRTA